MDDDPEIELLATELHDLQRANDSFALTLAPVVRIDTNGLKIECILSQLFPDKMERLKFELYYEGKRKEQLNEGHLRLQSAQLLIPKNRRKKKQG